ncbi:MAG: magnesium transporter [Planctomycetaceae bacterium]|jgi:magnesium transporter|nr:magnesium transporter [Planctomycetaceae bacterium]MBT6157791.1 magnesium transporter [Planctomycetaceae bacterium]MBT6484527.1 magnesium transporter [Planctomycetaceae bacterium]MBT6492980.1 magnesium transporter [Planctomycetaceae bacterium]
MYSQLLLPDLQILLQEDDADGLREFCEVFHPAATAEVLGSLSSAEVWRVLSHSPLPLQVEIFQFLELPLQVTLVEGVDRDRLTQLLEEMAPDDRVDLLERMDPELVERLLPLVAQAERSDIRRLLSFPEDSAGSIMTTEYASLPEDISVNEAIERLRQQAPDRETIYYVYVLDEERHLLGFVTLRELILARPDARLGDIMTRSVISVRVDDDQEVVANELARYDFIAIPVVDNQNRLVGIITHDDVLDVVQQEATEDAHRLGAVEPLEDSYLSTSLLTLTWKRGIWLVLLLGAALATASILRGFESTSQQFAWLILFLPLVLASGGNAGSQSATLVIRLLAVEQIDRSQNWEIISREFRLALLLGGGLAVLGFGSALLFEGVEPAAVVGVTVFLVVMLGTVTGAMLPLLFKSVGMDPALMSNPLIAAMVDVFGVVTYFSVALLMHFAFAG